MLNMCARVGRTMTQWFPVLLGMVVAGSMLVFIGNEALTIRLSSRVVSAGHHTLRITCRVKPDRNNIWLELGIADYRRSGVQLDGDSAAITHEFSIEPIPCDVSLAYCELFTKLRDPIVQSLSFEVAGCGH